MEEESLPKFSQKCPQCHKPAIYAHRPFCSRRCADIDLGKWLNGSFVIQGSENENMLAESLQNTSSSDMDTSTHLEE